jgi:hypothetical protein
LQKTGKEPFWAHALAKIAHKAAMESLEEAYRAVLNGKPTQKHHTIL